MSIEVKICGLSTPETMDAALDAGADYVAVNFFPPSPRSVTSGLAGELMRPVGDRAVKVGLFVDAEDAFIEEVLRAASLDLLQLHGSESVERVEAIRTGFGVPVMKVIKIRGAEDVARVEDFLEVSDRILFDAAPPADLENPLPGGNAVSFDWTYLRGKSWSKPWMLAGGLTVENLARAVELSGAPALDVSSGVEDRPGVKNPDKIRAFVRQAKSL
ncbi:phosphoribosylanthranilate isomerase [Denitrobaculum tricleocarpae]|uniref:N-(5'-phosphoribosyl)anthranilate isomerase n=1 Tax=Denitrobaculum tricleocarpae TaxID=2591009 RepID=A0A545TG53_9PROT|nr:phosphoribosylanthranilate isomerase [Denitrobaculum tricleocarpae]TQV76199.1 phosphoribosylanthranilate isomerase [Denitrobaculum tricleocarpae]